MKTLSIVLLAALVVGCAGPRKAMVYGTDHEYHDGRVSQVSFVYDPIWALPHELQVLAEKECSGPAKLTQQWENRRSGFSGSTYICVL